MKLITIVILLFYVKFFKIIFSNPILVQPIPEQTIRFNEPFDFTIPIENFSYEDYIKLSINSVLPDGLEKETRYEIELVGTFDNIGMDLQLFVQGDYCYLVDYFVDGFLILDVTNKANPVKVVRTYDDHHSLGIFVDGDTAYVVDQEDWKVINIEDKNNPFIVEVINGTEIITRFNNVFVLGDYIYVTDEYSGLMIYDKTTRNLVGSLVNDCQFADQIFVLDEYVFISRPPGISIIDVMDKTQPILISYDIEYHANGVFVSENYAFIVSEDGLKIFDISDKYNPSLVGSAGENIEYKHVMVSGDFAFVSKYSNQLGNPLIFDISDKTEPKLVATYNSSKYNYISEIFVADDYIYATSSLDEDFRIYATSESVNIFGRATNSGEFIISFSATDCCGTFDYGFYIKVECDTGWSGLYCNVPSSSCAPECINGICINVAVPPQEKFECHCNPLLWRGVLCETPVCDPECVNNEVCLSGDPHYCFCNETLWKENCDIPVCNPECINNEECLSGSPHYCFCDETQWSGNCDIPECTPECVNNEECVFGNPHYCFCDETLWSGNCDIPVCNPECKNGVCVVVPPENKRECHCDHELWKGQFCEIPVCIPECFSNYECIIGNNYRHFCYCDPYLWDGVNCNYPVCSPECVENEICLSDIPHTCFCNHSEGYSKNDDGECERGGGTLGIILGSLGIIGSICCGFLTLLFLIVVIILVVKLKKKKNYIPGVELLENDDQGFLDVEETKKEPSGKDTKDSSTQILTETKV